MMKHFSSSLPSSHNPQVNVRQPLPPREWFNDFPNVLTAYDQMVRLNGAIVEHANAAALSRNKAENADAEYSAAIKEALRTGTNVDDVTNKRDNYLAQAVAHNRLSDEAHTEATAHGYRFGALIKSVAAEVSAAAEARMLEAITELDRIEATKQAYRADIARAWPLRRSMSSMHYVGGSLHAYSTASPDDPRAELDAIKAEEAKVTARRAKEAGSQAQRDTTHGNVSS